MMKGRKIATIAALATSTAALAMLTGLAGARADELSDLRVNQQLLHERIDQLAAVGLQPGKGAVFSVDTNPAAGGPATAGSFPRSILIPGTDTSLALYGQVTTVLAYWMSGGNPNTSPQSTTAGPGGQVESAPLNNAGVTKARSNGNLSFTPRESKIGFETRTPTPLGEARTVIEFDFVGSNEFVPGQTGGTNPAGGTDPLLPRLRYAYGTLGGFLAGQATSNFSDPDANGETLDFGGNVGEPGKTRVPQLRYTTAVPFGGSFSVSAEAPTTQVGTANGLTASDMGVLTTEVLTTSCPFPAVPSATPTAATCTSALLNGPTPVNISKSTAPNFTAAWYLPQAWGHIDISAVVLPGLDVTDGKFFAKSYIGYGGHFGTDFKPGWFGWVKDDFIFHFVVGEAIGTYDNFGNAFNLATNYGMPSTTAANGTYGGLNVPATAANAANIIVKPTFEMGSEIGYQHWWADNLRSNINAGFTVHDGIPAKLVGATQANAYNKEELTFHANLIWNPVSSVDVGIEYMWGQRTVINNTTGGENVLLSKFAFRF